MILFENGLPPSRIMRVKESVEAERSFHVLRWRVERNPSFDDAAVTKARGRRPVDPLKA
jgi:hypothetical protein